MILVVVGDVKVDLAEKMIKARFNELSAPPKQVECFDMGKVEETGTDILYAFEPELGSTDLTISTHWNVQPEKDSISRQQQDMKKYVAVLMLRNRLQQLVRGNGYTQAVVAQHTDIVKQLLLLLVTNRSIRLSVDLQAGEDQERCGNYYFCS